MVSGSCEFGIDRTIAFVLRFLKKSLSASPSPSVSVPTWVPVSDVVVPMNPSRSKKNGSDRTPAQARRFCLVLAPPSLDSPHATVFPSSSERASLPVYFLIV